MWVPAKKEVRRPANANRQSAKKASGTTCANKFQPIAEDDAMDVGGVEDGYEAVFVRQEC